MNTKKWMTGILILWSLSLVRGQGVSVLDFRGGYLNPKDTEAGLIFAGSYGICIDDRVDLTLGLSYFYRNYQKQTDVVDSVSPGGIHQTTVVKELEYNTSLLPISANISIRFPFQPPLYWYAGGSLTYQFLFNNEKNYQEGISDKRTYKGWGWIIRGGIEYTIGTRTSLLLEAFYNIGKVKRNADETIKGLPVWDEVDVSGLGFRGGLRLEFF